MVLTINVSHLYKCPIDLVIKTYLRKSDHKNDVGDATKVEVISSHQEGEMTCIKRSLTMANYFPLFFRRIEPLKRDNVVVEEEIWSQPEESRYWIRSHDKTWGESIVIAQLAYASRFQANPKWTLWEQDTVIDLSGFGRFGIVLELFLKRHLNNYMKKDIKLMEKLMKNDVEK